MAQTALDLASSLGSGRTSHEMGESGISEEILLQMQVAPSPARPIPKNFVWRLDGGRRSSSASLSDIRGDMAVDVPVLRETFDPWSHDEHEEDDDGQEGRCKGCTKISKARAAATAAAARPSHAPKPGE
ncbi:hypothetical protein MFIFM68171_05790 [Madurella fahalii]|uniref:Uncharacterized protein n=1 Tax=Madurella fahalii TaxID=1157608 RepID=A0ABQ0GD15_9PEZI